MFQGDHPAVGQVMRRACRLAHELGHPGSAANTCCSR